MDTASFITKSQNIHKNKYEYFLVKYIKACLKVDIICKQHGKFTQRASAHIAGQGCPQCALQSKQRHNNNFTKLDFIQKSKSIHKNKYDYKSTKYKRMSEKVDIICKQHGKFTQRASAHIAGQGCPQCGTNTKTTEEFIKNANKIHQNKYDYTLSKYNGVFKPIIIICKQHGKFTQKPQIHLSGHGCHQCGLDKSTITPLSNIKEFIIKASKKHNNVYNYKYVNYQHSKNNIKIKCDKHGIFLQTPNCHLNGNGCPTCAGTHLQENIYEFIKQHISCSYNDRKQIQPKEIDIYIPQIKFGIEVNGLYWHSYNHHESHDEKYSHLNKLNDCIDNGIDLIQIMENEWRDKRKIIESMILNKIGKSKRIYARNCIICYPKSCEYIEFMDKNHLQGNRHARTIIGLKSSDKVVMMLSLQKHQKYKWEITRIATATGCTVVGGASKLLSNFEKNYNPVSIMTYANRRYSNGGLYKKLGFNLIDVTKPNYQYVKRGIVFSRQQYQKHKLSKKLQNFNNNLSESSNMFNNGFRRIWDCGNLKFLKTY